MHRLSVFVIILLAFSCTRVENPRVRIVTDLGSITIELYTDRALVTANNFLAYIDSGKYIGKADFYRIVRLDNQPNNSVKIEVIQAGFLEDSLIERYQFPPIPHESTEQTGIKHEDGIVSMARLEPGTASSEFFICIGSQPSLDKGGARNADGEGFSAFGKVVDGMDVVRKIHQLPDTLQYIKSPVRIIRAYRVDDKE